MALIDLMWAAPQRFVPSRHPLRSMDGGQFGLFPAARRAHRPV